MSRNWGLPKDDLSPETLKRSKNGLTADRECLVNLAYTQGKSDFYERYMNGEIKKYQTSWADPADYKVVKFDNRNE